jgi:hypothetical protein
MALWARVEMFVHFETFRNVDLFGQVASAPFAPSLWHDDTVAYNVHVRTSLPRRIPRRWRVQGEYSLRTRFFTESTHVSAMATSQFASVHSHDVSPQVRRPGHGPQSAHGPSP